MSETITIIGDGAMATVCSILLLQHRQAKVAMWGRNVQRLFESREQARLLPGTFVPDAVRLTAEDRDCFDGATLILSAIPTQYIREVWTRLAPFVPKGVPIISVAKGIETDTVLRPTQILAGVLGEGSHGMAALSGPNIAAELALRMPGTAVAASADATLAQRVQKAFSCNWFRVYTNDDVVGVELAGATKNIIALAAGILDGLGAGNNAKALLVTRGLVEMSRLGVVLGARADTFQGLAGLGDLITTCVSPLGRNRSVGERIGRGEKLADVLASTPSVAEGVPTTHAVLQLARKHDVEMPITETLHAVLFEGKPVKVALTELMTREPKPEREV